MVQRLFIVHFKRKVYIFLSFNSPAQLIPAFLFLLPGYIKKKKKNVVKPTLNIAFNLQKIRF